MTAIDTPFPDFPKEGDVKRCVFYFEMHEIVISPDGLRQLMTLLAKRLARQSTFVTRIALGEVKDGRYWVGFNHSVFATSLQSIVRVCYGKAEKVRRLKEAKYRLPMVLGSNDLRFSRVAPKGVTLQTQLLLDAAEAIKLFEAGEKERRKGRGYVDPFRVAGRELRTGVRNFDVQAATTKAARAAVDAGKTRLVIPRITRFGRRKRILPKDGE